MFSWQLQLFLYEVHPFRFKLVYIWMVMLNAWGPSILQCERISSVWIGQFPLLLESLYLKINLPLFNIGYWVFILFSEYHSNIILLASNHTLLKLTLLTLNIVFTWDKDFVVVLKKYISINLCHLYLFLFLFLIMTPVLMYVTRL